MGRFQKQLEWAAGAERIEVARVVVLSRNHYLEIKFSIDKKVENQNISKISSVCLETNFDRKNDRNSKTKFQL